MSVIRKRCVHNGVIPWPEYHGIMFTQDGKPCCSELEGEFKTPDGDFDVEAAERQCEMSTRLGQFNAEF